MRSTLHLLTLVDQDGTRHPTSYVPERKDYGKQWIFVRDGKYYEFDTVNEGLVGDDHVFVEVDKKTAYELLAMPRWVMIQLET